MADTAVILASILAVAGLMIFGTRWLSAIADLCWMAAVRPKTVLAALLVCGIAPNLALAVFLPQTGYAATRLALAFVLAPLPARWLADRMVWWCLPADQRPKSAKAALFAWAEASKQQAFIAVLGERLDAGLSAVPAESEEDAD